MHHAPFYIFLVKVAEEKSSKKKSTKEFTVLEKAEIEKQNDQNIKEDKSKNLKKENTEKTIPKRKYNIEITKNNNNETTEKRNLALKSRDENDAKKIRLGNESNNVLQKKNEFEFITETDAQIKIESNDILQEKYKKFKIRIMQSITFK